MEMILWLELLFETLPIILLRSIFIWAGIIIILKIKKKDCKILWLICSAALILYYNILYEATFGINGGFTVVENKLPPDLLPHMISQDDGFQTILNVFLFLPLGFLLPLVFSRIRKWYTVILISGLTSLLVEILQYFSGRSMDINDIIFNVIGAGIGYLLKIGVEKFILLFRKKKAM